MTEFARLISEVERTNRLLALLATRGLKQKEAVALLHSAGLAPKEIAACLRTTANTVSVTLANLKKASGRKSAPTGVADGNEP